ncbi:hypothetical protein ACQW02_02115 [Humitalea sp. 24SJ18S-53]|uniref:hypothetical protein n=1 Tax=Humitalea sp. 24SJ18S-53 TaxID=3422307 RepID=UPI003D67EC72
MPETQQLLATDSSVNLTEALGARVKDPLWFLARQWQTGEFEAENGGKPVAMRYDSRIDPFREVVVGGTSLPLTGAEPLEALVEAERPDHSAPAWNSTELDYGFGLSSAERRFVATEYGGRALDWYHFDQAKQQTVTGLDQPTVEMVPNGMGFRGAPYPRWWRFEDGDEAFDSAADVEPNVLSMLLPEFFYVDINNWYLIPAPMPAGSLRQITRLVVEDSFGVVTELAAAADADWQVFSVAATDGAALGGPPVLMAPNVAIDIVENDVLEDVRFVRDEGANLVWAFEQLYHTADGARVTNADGVPRGAPTARSPGTEGEFRLFSDTLPAWIPYVPRQIDARGGLGREVRLRRGRTVETASAANPQFNSVLVGETKFLNEEEVPKTGLRVRRTARYARGSDGKPWFWVGRAREAGRGSGTPGLRFDYLDRG